ncbi:MAG: nucleotidyltransferase domain-containing protein [Anaerolineales bacterium]|nr:nucleotidyltransferase domain-containing protein [Anaerolineales bacterium]
MILFGSHARGEATEESDVDVLVLLQIYRGLFYSDKLNAIETREV